MNIKKKLGRPKKFDEKQALIQAINVFWEKGYDGASIKDLTYAMNINSPSLYAAFKDKKNLYLRAIELYMNDACAPIDAFFAQDDIKKAVKAFMQVALENATEQTTGRQGCFMTNCVSNSVCSVSGTKELLKKAIFLADQKLAKRFEREKDLGNLPNDFPSLERAKLMFDLRQGHVIRARAGINKEDMQKDLDYRVKIVLGIDKFN